MLGWTVLNCWMAACWKVSWNVDPLPLSVPERPELPLDPPPPLDPQAAVNAVIATRATPAAVKRWTRRRCMSDTSPFLGCDEHRFPRRQPSMCNADHPTQTSLSCHLYPHVNPWDTGSEKYQNMK